MNASYKKHILNFKKPGGTSRGILTQKETWFIKLQQDGKVGYGECGLFRGLSADDRPDYEDVLKWVCLNIHLDPTILLKELQQFPSIQFGLETAFRSVVADDPYLLFPSPFTNGSDAIPINGLIWMGDIASMKAQIKNRIGEGFNCIKLKIGSLDFEQEYGLLKSLRNEYSERDIELRVDANGAFRSEDALDKLKRLSELNLHSIEQPIKQGQFQEMAHLCEYTPLPIALDEELIGVLSTEKKQELLNTIKPQYIILKPSLIGGYSGSEEWIEHAEAKNVGWWITSALESNIGLNAIAQWTYSLGSSLPQGLGTGSLFTNNFQSPLKVKNGTLRYENKINWIVNI